MPKIGDSGRAWFGFAATFQHGRSGGNTVGRPARTACEAVRQG